MRSLPATGVDTDSYVSSHVACCDALLLKSAEMRQQDRRLQEEWLPRLPTYDDQVTAARSLTCYANERARHVIHLVEVLTKANADTNRRRQLSSAAEEELRQLRCSFGQKCVAANGAMLSLKDLGWSARWRDPHPKCSAFRNSIIAINNLSHVLSIEELWQYGLVPSDLDEYYIEVMEQSDFLTEVSYALLAEYSGDWRALLRDDNLAGRRLC